MANVSSTIANVIGGEPKVPPIRHGEQCRLDQSLETALRADQHVLDNPVRRRDLAVAVVPRELQQVNKIECGLRVCAELLGEAGSSLSPSLCTSDCHGGSVARPILKRCRMMPLRSSQVVDNAMCSPSLLVGAGR